MSDLNNGVRPTFGQGNNSSSNVVPSAADTERLNNLINARKNRSEVGAAWLRQSRTSNSQYLKIRLRFTKEELQQLLNNTPDGPVSDDTPFLELVAFQNASQEQNPKRPAYRIYKAIE
jgi:hypothetical protein